MVVRLVGSFICFFLVFHRPPLCFSFLPFLFLDLFLLPFHSLSIISILSLCWNISSFYFSPLFLCSFLHFLPIHFCFTSILFFNIFWFDILILASLPFPLLSLVFLSSFHFPCVPCFRYLFSLLHSLAFNFTLPLHFSSLYSQSLFLSLFLLFTFLPAHLFISFHFPPFTFYLFFFCFCFCTPSLLFLSLHFTLLQYFPSSQFPLLLFF